MSKDLLKENFVFILEKQNQILESSKVEPSVDGDGEYYLEGVAAVFGEENNNNRIYDETEYMPHLAYLKEKIEQKRLLGELDHPEKFDISLKNISHVVQDLNYDKETRTLRIKVKLLDTPAGQIAKKLVDAGIPISISSRAAGTVGDGKKVQIKKIFTYDLVADPGFQNAQLERVYESAGFIFEDNKTKSVTNGLTCISESFGLEKDSGVEIYKIDNEIEFKQILKTQDKNKSTQMEETNKEFVTVDDLNNYSILLKKEIDSIKSALGGLKESESSEVKNDNSGLEERIGKLEKYSEYLAENLDGAIKYGEYLAENLDNSISYSKYLAENLDQSISYGKYLSENLDKSITYTEYVAENVDANIENNKELAKRVEEGISYTEYVAENLDSSISYAEYLAEGLDKGIHYSEYIAEKLDKGIQYSEYLAESVNKTVSYSDYLAENMNKGIDYSDYLSEKLSKSISYSEYIAESISTNEGTTKINESAREKAELASNAQLNESGFAGDYQSLSGKIDNLLESVKTQKTETPINEGAKTQKVQTEKVLNESETSNEDATGIKFIDEMPEKFRASWDSLNESHKNSIMAQAALRNLETTYQISDFWATRNLGVETLGLQKLNENQTAESTEEVREGKTIGYSNEYMERISRSLEGKFGRK